MWENGTELFRREEGQPTKKIKDKQGKQGCKNREFQVT